MKPLASGPGIVLGDPIAAGDAASGAAGPDTTEVLDFGAGCTRWLQLELSNHLELGKTPAWPQLSAAADSAHWADWRLTTQRAVALKRLLGVSHAVTSSIAGNAQAATLTLQLRTVPDGKEVGASFKAQGSYEAINAALPTLARDILTQLGVSNAGVPDTTGASAATLIACGRAPLDASKPLPAGQRQVLLDAAKTMPLAGILAWRDRDRYAPTGNLAFAVQSDNIAVQSFVAYVKSELLRVEPENHLQAAELHSNNFLLAYQQVMRARGRGDDDAAQQAGERMVRCAPYNAQAWLLLADTLSEKGDSIRKARFFGEMNEGEQAEVMKIYPLWQAASARATQLNPQNASAWLSLAISATFNGGPEASAAFWKAQALAPDSRAVYDWGLQMFQPKWAADPQDLKRLLSLITAKTERVQSLSIELMQFMDTHRGDDETTLAVQDTVFKGVLIAVAELHGLRVDPKNFQEIHNIRLERGPMMLSDWVLCADVVGSAAPL